MGANVCIDASLVLAWLLFDEYYLKAIYLIQDWETKGVDMVTAPLFHAEITSVLRNKVYFKKIRPEYGEEAFSLYQTIKIRTYDSLKTQKKAWELAKTFNLPKAYDMQYLAVAELEDCEMWTGDKKLYNSCCGKNKRIKWIGEIS